MGRRGEEVWSWGAGTHGQLACATRTDALTPQFVACLHGEAIKDMACGGAHAVLLLETGEVTTWGRGQSGPLGHGDEITTTLPKVVNALLGIRIRNVAAGWSHTAFVTESGELYTCGDGTFGQLGLGDNESRLLPCRIENLTSGGVTMTACGMRHTLALVQVLFVSGSSETTIAYAFGSNKRGQLGIQSNPYNKATKDAGRFSCPQRITSLDLHGIVSISANGDHSAALTGTGMCFLWGRGFNNSADISCPCAIPLDLKFLQVSVGWSHGLALTENKEVYAWGSNRHGQLGIPQPLDPDNDRQNASACSTSGVEDISKPLIPSKQKDTGPFVHDKNSSVEMTLTKLGFRKVDSLGSKVSWVSAGSEHSTAVLDHKKLMVWGWAEHGQLGLDSTEDQNFPHEVSFQQPTLNSELSSTTQMAACDSNVQTKVYCGSGFTFVIRNMTFKSTSEP